MERVAVVAIQLDPQPVIDQYNSAALEMGIDFYVVTTDKRLFDSNSNLILVEDGASENDLLSKISDKVGANFHVFTESELFLDVTKKLQELPAYQGYCNLEFELPRSKWDMKQIFKKSRIPCATGIKIDGSKSIKSLDPQFEYPVIVKPESGLSSCGVYKCRNNEELGIAVRKSHLLNIAVLKNKFKTGLSIIIEEFMLGVEYSVDTYWANGRVVGSFILTRNKMNDSTFPDELYFFDPNISETHKSNLIGASIECGKALKIKNGVTHTEMKISGDETPKVIETTPRSGANGMFHLLFSRLVRDNTAKIRLSQYAKIKPNDLFKIENRENIHLAFIQPRFPSKGKFQKFKNLEKIKHQSFYLTNVSFLKKNDSWNGGDFNLSYSIWFLIEAQSRTDLNKNCHFIKTHCEMSYE